MKNSLLCFKLLVCFLICGSTVRFAAAQTPPFFNVKNYGAVGDSVTLDTPAINSAITAANAAGGGTVTFPAGNYLSVSIHLTNNVTLYLSNSAVILAAASGFDDAEPNPYVTCAGHTAFPDIGHQHFHNSLIWGDGLHDIGVMGPGTINGDSNLTQGNPTAGQGDKALTLRLCTNVVISGVTITRAGHFGILANGCFNFTMTNMSILNATASNHRDAINLINSSHCFISNCQIEGSDDAMCLKADWALGQKFTNTDIQIINCTIRSTQNNAVQFGSETVGDFYNVRFANLNLIEAGKAGIGITSNDGSIMDGITFDQVTMTNCACTIFLKLSNQDRYSADCDPHPVGRIRNVSINNVVARHSVSSSIVRTNTATLAGCLSNNVIIPMENIVFSNVNISTIGGNLPSAVDIVPPETQDWQPNTMGVRPSYGWYIRHVQNVSFYNCQTHFDIADGRPALIAYDVQGIKLDGFVADAITTGPNASPYDLGFTNVTGYEVSNATITNGSGVRILAANSTQATIVSPPLFSPSSGGYSNPVSVTLTSLTANATIRFTTDGTTPSPSAGAIYSGPITIGTNTIVKAIAYANGLTNSAVNTAIYNLASSTPVAATPTFSPPGGNYAATQSVTIASTTAGASIRYTTDGTAPSSTNGIVYSGPIAISSNLVLNAVVYATNVLDSAVGSAAYTITGAATAPVFTPLAGRYTSAQFVTISSATIDAAIRYTIDGSDPSSVNGTLYSAPITVGVNTTIKAIAFAPGATDSAISTAAYVIVPPPPSLTFEAELIPFVTNGATAVVQSDANSSNGQWEALQATVDGSWIEYTLANVPAGQYQLSFKWKGNTSNRGIITHSVDGVAVGDSVDLYSSAQTYPETNLTVVTFTNTGAHTVRQTVIGKNPSGTGSRWTSADKFTLTLVQSLPSNFTSAFALTNGSVQLSGTGYPTLNYIVQANTDLTGTNWVNIGNITADSQGALQFLDTNTVGQAQRFYRFVAP